MAIEKTSVYRQTLLKNNVFSVVTCNKKHFSKPGVTMTNTLDKKFFVVTPLEGL